MCIFLIIEVQKLHCKTEWQQGSFEIHTGWSPSLRNNLQILLLVLIMWDFFRTLQ